MRKYYIAWNSIALSAGVAKTILELPTPANVEIEVCELYIGNDDTGAGNMIAEFGTFTTTGTGTAATPQKWLGDRTVDSAVTAAKVADTVEPTGFSGGTLGGALYPNWSWPLPGVLPWQWPLQEGFTVTESVNFALRLNSSVAGNTRGYLAWKE